MADIESEDHALTNSMFFFLFSFRLESVSPYLARQFAPYARTLIDEYIQGNSEMDEVEEEEGEDLEIDENGDVIELESEGDVELKQPYFYKDIISVIYSLLCGDNSTRFSNFLCTRGSNLLKSKVKRVFEHD